MVDESLIINSLQYLEMRFFMKKIVLALCAAVSLALLSGCAGTGNTPVHGVLYTDAKGPLLVTGSAAANKVGEATCTSILGLIGTGDCSIEAAAKAGRITEVSMVDTKVNVILGVYATSTTIVRGR